MLSDIQIAQEAPIANISEIADALKLQSDEWIHYGKHIAKLDFTRIQERLTAKPQGKLILVTAISPTPSGEGKTTVSLGLTQALHHLQKNVIASLREPSLGPVFGRKGGATGGGFAQMIPMPEINLHFTGDIHAITTANNLISAAIDNHIYQENTLKINPQKIVWRRCLDMNDRALRNCQIIVGKDGQERTERFQISVASEIMAILCLSKDYQDLKKRLANLVIAYNEENDIITPQDLNIVGSLCALLQNALQPNLVQTLNHAPVLVHGGPFANIAHGCSSVISTKLGLKLADYVVTEAGFGADLGGEKFMDIKCRQNGLKPDVAVLVITLKALYHQNQDFSATLHLGHLQKHINLLKSFGLPVVVAGNHFQNDEQKDWRLIEKFLSEQNIPFATVTAYIEGSLGATGLAQTVLNVLDLNSNEPTFATEKIANYEFNHQTDLNFPYSIEDDFKTKITKLAQKIYGAGDVHLPEKVQVKLSEYENKGYKNLPICVAKTPFSFTDDARILGAPEGFTLKITDVALAAGAGFVLFYAGDISTMPGLPRKPAATQIQFDTETLKIDGLF